MEGIPEGWLAPLPEEVVVTILSKSPVKSLMRFKCVSKRWLALITSDSCLIASHLRQSLANQLSILWCVGIELELANYYQDTLLLRDEFTIERFDISYHCRHEYGVTIVGSCNGLVCLSLSKTGRETVLLNPATKEFRFLPEPIMSSGHGSDFRKPLHASMGFGYDQHSKDYKLVRIVRILLDIEGVQVFTQSSNSWRKVRHDLTSTYVVPDFAPVAANGALHWLGWGENKFKFCVLSFDLHEEKFNAIASPPEEKENHCAFRLANWRESLVALEGYNFWLFSDTEKSWTKLFTINVPYSIDCDTAFGVWRDEVLLYGRKDGVIILYEHPRICGKRTGEKIKLIKKLGKLIGSRVRYSFQAIDYVESLVSVHPTVSST